jgi:hypothetical protein
MLHAQLVTAAILHRVGRHRSIKQTTNVVLVKALTPSRQRPKGGRPPYPCHRIEPVIGVDFVPSHRDARFRSGKISELRWLGFLFFRIKNRAVVRGVHVVERLERCRFRGAHGGAPESRRNGNHRHGCRTKEMIEVWKLIKSRGGDVRKGKQSPKTHKDRKFIIEPHFASRKSLM